MSNGTNIKEHIAPCRCVCKFTPKRR